MHPPQTLCNPCSKTASSSFDNNYNIEQTSSLRSVDGFVSVVASSFNVLGRLPGMPRPNGNLPSTSSCRSLRSRNDSRLRLGTYRPLSGWLVVTNVQPSLRLMSSYACRYLHNFIHELQTASKTTKFHPLSHTQHEVLCIKHLVIKIKKKIQKEQHKTTMQQAMTFFWQTSQVNMTWLLSRWGTSSRYWYHDDMPHHVRYLMTEILILENVILISWLTNEKLTTVNEHTCSLNKMCGRPPQYAPASWTLTFWPWKWCPIQVGYLCVNFSLPRPLYSRFRPDVRDRRQMRIIA